MRFGSAARSGGTFGLTVPGHDRMGSVISTPVVPTEEPHHQPGRQTRRGAVVVAVLPEEDRALLLSFAKHGVLGNPYEAGAELDDRGREDHDEPKETKRPRPKKKIASKSYEQPTQYEGRWVTGVERGGS